MTPAPMNEAEERAAQIMREFKPKTLGEIFAIARGKALADGELSAFLDLEGDCENGWAWRVVDAHYKNLRNPEYRAAAGLGPIERGAS